MKRGRKSLREQLTDSHRASSFYAAMAGKPPPPAPVIATKRTRKRSANGKPLERHVLRAVLEALRHHPMVAEVRRNQSGLFQQGDRVIRVGHRGALDIEGVLKGGTAFSIECKSPTGRLTSEQQATIDRKRAAGVRVGVARSVEDAIAIIEGK